uniref:Uncharacterized protein n=1 Tax=Chromera velia CCMP2878 TaxID=1169474 RepID=A0A0G4FH19_9ALVE|eukprot:Cvel_3321.t1-p1 / transcript=Cvel_3321.t1 / gene=Cvel_3321 / organism=Chromera_velia_CCMP2878 / gene_product=hypothetical protein / transcript_product=hypothetical protein / location=Cvel_scaffold132:16263-27304(-) / protein_length=1361 / sequence_SO=supercontig / SO=protein_coding / is_pseudo=false
MSGYGRSSSSSPFTADDILVCSTLEFLLRKARVSLKDPNDDVESESLATRLHKLRDGASEKGQISSTICALTSFVEGLEDRIEEGRNSPQPGDLVPNGFLGLLARKVVVQFRQAPINGLIDAIRSFRDRLRREKEQQRRLLEGGDGGEREGRDEDEGEAGQSFAQEAASRSSLSACRERERRQETKTNKHDKVSLEDRREALRMRLRKARGRREGNQEEEEGMSDGGEEEGMTDSGQRKKKRGGRKKEERRDTREEEERPLWLQELDGLRGASLQAEIATRWLEETEREKGRIAEESDDDVARVKEQARSRRVAMAERMLYAAENGWRCLPTPETLIRLAAVAARDSSERMVLTGGGRSERVLRWIRSASESAQESACASLKILCAVASSLAALPPTVLSGSLSGPLLREGDGGEGNIDTMASWESDVPRGLRALGTCLKSAVAFSMLRVAALCCSSLVLCLSAIAGATVRSRLQGSVLHSLLLCVSELEGTLCSTGEGGEGGASCLSWVGSADRDTFSLGRNVGGASGILPCPGFPASLNPQAEGGERRPQQQQPQPTGASTGGDGGGPSGLSFGAGSASELALLSLPLPLPFPFAVRGRVAETAGGVLLAPPVDSGGRPPSASAVGMPSTGFAGGQGQGGGMGPPTVRARPSSALDVEEGEEESDWSGEDGSESGDPPSGIAPSLSRLGLSDLVHGGVLRERKEGPGGIKRQESRLMSQRRWAGGRDGQQKWKELRDSACRLSLCLLANARTFSSLAQARREEEGGGGNGLLSGQRSAASHVAAVGRALSAPSSSPALFGISGGRDKQQQGKSDDPPSADESRLREILCFAEEAVERTFGVSSAVRTRSSGDAAKERARSGSNQGSSDYPPTAFCALCDLCVLRCLPPRSLTRRRHARKCRSLSEADRKDHFGGNEKRGGDGEMRSEGSEKPPPPLPFSRQLFRFAASLQRERGGVCGPPGQTLEWSRRYGGGGKEARGVTGSGSGSPGAEKERAGIGVLEGNRRGRAGEGDSLSLPLSSADARVLLPLAAGCAQAEAEGDGEARAVAALCRAEVLLSVAVDCPPPPTCCEDDRPSGPPGQGLEEKENTEGVVRVQRGCAEGGIGSSSSSDADAVSASSRVSQALSLLDAAELLLEQTARRGSGRGGIRGCSSGDFTFSSSSSSSGFGRRERERRELLWSRLHEARAIGLLSLLSLAMGAEGAGEDKAGGKSGGTGASSHLQQRGRARVLEETAASLEAGLRSAGWTTLPDPPAASPLGTPKDTQQQQEEEEDVCMDSEQRWGSSSAVRGDHDGRTERTRREEVEAAGGGVRLLGRCKRLLYLLARVRHEQGKISERDAASQAFIRASAVSERGGLRQL